jgi:hypothetical protein
MSIGFRVKTDEELHAEFSKLDDPQLIKTGRLLKDFAKPRPGQGRRLVAAVENCAGSLAGTASSHLGTT